ncbi:MAG: NAD(P)-dependent alcohol dehydrogenase [Chloroflexi bacterium]|nr:NAD(P)-dependent alcohol dehydrogenase [Chloroflexota bacterium]
MKAIVWTAYGSPEVLQLREVEKPVPKDNEVLIQIHATTVTKGDTETRSLKLPLFLGLPMRIYVGLNKPKRITIPGQELAGDIESVGKDVTLFKAGDQVFGSPGFGMGAYAEYICLPEKSEGTALAIMPANATYEEAACITLGGREALHFLRKGNIQRGERILINGAGGSIGTFAIQLAKYFGAEVTGVDSGEKLEMLHSIGADEVIDYTQEDFTKSGVTYDAIFDVVGNISLSSGQRSLRENGRYLLANPRVSQIVGGLWTSMTSSKKVVMQTADATPEDLVFLSELIEAGEIKSVIDRTYPLEQIPEAHRYVEKGHKKGNVVITLDPQILHS